MSALSKREQLDQTRLYQSGAVNEMISSVNTVYLALLNRHKALEFMI